MGRIPLHASPERRRDFSRSQGHDVCSRFYEDYQKVAEEYDKEFNKRYDEDLNTTLIFVSLSVASCSNDTY